jgi:hypothetical protein
MPPLQKARNIAVLMVAAAFLLWALDFVLSGLLAIHANGWREIYADQWRLYRVYLEHPFPLNVLMLENGHRPVFPGLVRVAELHWLSGNQIVQLGFGALMALATFILFALTVWRDRAAGVLPRSAAVAMAGFAVFWLGNSRILLHGNESVHAFLLTACLGGAVLLLVARPVGAFRLGLACVLCFVATFCFGPGLAAFAAIALLLAVQRQYRAAAIVCVAMVAALVVYMVLPGSAGVRHAVSLRLWSNLALAATWLSSMPVNLFEVALVPGSGHMLPEGTRNLFAPVADAYHAAFGDVRLQHGHIAWVGLAAMAYVAWATVQAWRRRETGSLRLAGIAVAAFAMGVAGIVALSRLAYFDANPSQVFAHRYMPWTCLFWLGVAWIALGGAPSTLRIWRLAAVLPLIGVVLYFGHLTTDGYRLWGQLVQRSVAAQATGIAAGVVEAERGMGETLYEEVVAGLPLVKAAGVSMFRWSEARIQGRHVALVQEAHPGSAQAAMETRVIANRLEDDRPALLVLVRLPAESGARLPRRLLVLDRDDVAVGILSSDGADEAWTHAGHARLQDPAEIGAIAELHDDQARCLAACRTIRTDASW